MNLKLMDTGLSITYTQQQIVQRRFYSLKNPAIEQWKKVRLKDLKSSAQWEATHCGDSHFKPNLIIFGFVDGSPSLPFYLILFFNSSYLILSFHIIAFFLCCYYLISLFLIIFLELVLVFVASMSGIRFLFEPVGLYGDRVQRQTTCQRALEGSM